MNLKRVISGLIGFPIVVVIMLLGNLSVHVIDIAICILAVISMYEFLHCFKSTKKANPISWVCYMFCLIISIIHCIPQVIPNEFLVYIIAIAIPLLITVLFAQVIITNLKINIVDIAVTLLGICYVAVFFAFIPLVFGMKNGNFFIWYIIFSAWGTDVFAYVIGKRFGKHKFSQISPNKSIEGCISGTIGAIIICIVYTIFINKVYVFNINYLVVAFITFILSIVGQLGDFSASSIKRYVGVKDFSNLIPGHGGILDRFDSLIFIAPFAYLLLMLI